MYLACTSQSPPKHMACTSHVPGFGVALVWLWGGLWVARSSQVDGLLVACGWLVGGFRRRVSGPVLGTVRSWRTCCAILSQFVPERWFENVPSWHTFASAEGVLEGRNNGTCPLERTGGIVSPRQPGLEDRTGRRCDNELGGE